MGMSQRAMASEPPAAPAMAVPYYVAEGGEARGPLSLDVLLGEIRDGAVLPWTLVWKPGLSAWIKAGALPELATALAEAVPRPPPPPPQPPEPPDDPPAEALYFVADGTTARGPFSDAEISAAIATGEIGRNTFVWWPGAAGWTAAGDVPALVGRFIVKPPEVTPAEAMRQLIVGTWEFTPALGEAIGARTTLTFNADMGFAGQVAVTVADAAAEIHTVTGTWAIPEATGDGFVLALTPRNGTSTRTELRVLDRDTLVNSADGGRARRLPD
jgi:hypothetical protein